MAEQPDEVFKKIDEAQGRLKHLIAKLNTGVKKELEIRDDKVQQCQSQISDHERRLKDLAAQLDQKDVIIKSLTEEVKRRTHAPVVAIDLGNTKCSMTYFEDGKVYQLTDESGETVFNASMRHTMRGPEMAEDPLQLGVDPVTESDISHLPVSLGLAYKDFSKMEHDAVLMLPCSTIQNATGFIDFCFPDSTRRSAVSFMATFLSKLQKLATAQLNQREVTEALIVIPSNYNDVQKAELVRAAKAARLNSVHLITEPMAAFKAYEYHVPAKAPSRSVLILTAGACHADLAMFKDGKMIGAKTSNAMTGDMVDLAIFNMCLSNWKLEAASIPKSFKLQLKSECKKFKEHLSSGVPNAKLTIEFNDKSLEFQMTIDHFMKQILSNLIASWGKAIDEIIKSSGQPDEVAFCGGAALFPQISNSLANKFPKLCVSRRICYPGAVAVGAALACKDAASLNEVYQPFEASLWVDYRKSGKEIATSSSFSVVKCLICPGAFSIRLNEDHIEKKAKVSAIRVKQKDVDIAIVEFAAFRWGDIPFVINFDLDEFGIIENIRIDGIQNFSPLFYRPSIVDKLGEDIDFYWKDAHERKKLGCLYNDIDSAIIEAQSKAKSADSEKRSILEAKIVEWTQFKSRLNHESFTAKGLQEFLKEIRDYVAEWEVTTVL